MVAVAIRTPVLAAAAARENEDSHSPEAIADGGRLLVDEDAEGEATAANDQDLEAQFRASFAEATAARACVFGNDHCQGPEGEMLPCFDCHMAATLDHYPADSTAVADVPDLETVIVAAEADTDKAEE